MINLLYINTFTTCKRHVSIVIKELSNQKAFWNAIIEGYKQTVFKRANE